MNMQNLQSISIKKQCGFSMSTVLVFSILIALVVIPSAMQYQYNQKITASLIFKNQIYHNSLSESLIHLDSRFNNNIENEITTDDLNPVSLQQSPVNRAQIIIPEATESDVELNYERNSGAVPGFSVDDYTGELYELEARSNNLFTRGRSQHNVGFVLPVPVQ